MDDTPAGDTGSTGQWTADSIPSQLGRVFLVTGANSGIGYETSRALAAHGASVIMAVRDEAKGVEAVERLKAEHPDATVELRHLYLADLDSGRAFAPTLDGVHMLINNTRGMNPPRPPTQHGVEMQIRVKL